MRKYNWFIFVGILVAFTATLLLVRADNENKIRANLVADWQKFYVKKEQEVAYIDTTPHKSKHMALSEAQGYGMEIAAMNPHGKKADFDHLYRYYLANRETGSQLMSWKQVKDGQNWHYDKNSATDGDVFIAYSLILAARRWHDASYRQQAVKLINDIMFYEVNHETNCLTVGNWANKDSKYYYLFRTSDCLPKELKAFYQVTGDKRWLVVRETMLKYLKELSAQSKSGLVPDFAWVSKNGVKAAKGKVVSSKYDGDYASNACRVPMNLAGVDDPDARYVCKRMLKFFSKQSTVTAGYSLKGEALNHYQSRAFSAPIFLMASSYRNQGFDNLFSSQKYVLLQKLNGRNYYDDVLVTLTAVVK